MPEKGLESILLYDSPFGCITFLQEDFHEGARDYSVSSESDHFFCAFRAAGSGGKRKDVVRGYHRVAVAIFERRCAGYQEPETGGQNA